MKGFINNFDFYNMEAMKYYSPPKSWDAEKIREQTTSKIFSGDWFGAQKRDGAFYMFICDEDGNKFLRGRSKNVNGEFLDKYDWVPHLHSFFDEMEAGTVLLGEIYLPRDEQAKTTTSFMNCLKEKAIKRQEKEENKLHYYIFDILAWNGEILINTPAQDRFEELTKCSRALPSQYVEWAEYKNGKELWGMLQELLADGYEGVVILNKDSAYEPGKRSNRVSLKVKKELQDTIDCIVIGANPPTKNYSGKEIETWEFWFDEADNKKILASDFFNEHHKTIYSLFTDGATVIPVTKNWFYGWAGSLKLGAIKDGKEVHIGNLSGITDEIKEYWKDYIDKVCEVSAMEIMTNQDGGYGLRHPKLIGWRDDINKSECTWERIFDK